MLTGPRGAGLQVALLGDAERAAGGQPVLRCARAACGPVLSLVQRVRYRLRAATNTVGGSSRSVRWWRRRCQADLGGHQCVPAGGVGGASSLDQHRASAWSFSISASSQLAEHVAESLTRGLDVAI
jgi:hypothetical protein